MKNLFLLLVASTLLFGCYAEKRIGYVTYYYPKSVSMDTLYLPFDTIPVIMLACDTSLQQLDIPAGSSCWNCPKTYYDHSTVWMLGYEVVVNDGVGPVHVAFLDIKKQRSTYFVWITYKR